MSRPAWEAKEWSEFVEESLGKRLLPWQLHVLERLDLARTQTVRLVYTRSRTDGWASIMRAWRARFGPLELPVQKGKG